jgi:hypothetical protein
LYSKKEKREKKMKESYPKTTESKEKKGKGERKVPSTIG